METIQPLEVIWSLICTVGLVFSAYNIWDALHDMVDVSLATFDGARQAAIETAKLTVITEAIRGTKQLMLLTIGVIALLLPPTETIGSAHPTQGLFISVLFIAFALLLTANTIITFYGRRRILRLVAISQERKEEVHG